MRPQPDARDWLPIVRVLSCNSRRRREAAFMGLGDKMNGLHDNEEYRLPGERVEITRACRSLGSDFLISLYLERRIVVR